jgi:hypothetical protein
VVLSPEQSQSEGQQIAGALMREFGIQPGDICAYVDLLSRKAWQRRVPSAFGYRQNPTPKSGWSWLTADSRKRLLSGRNVGISITYLGPSNTA